MHPTWLSQPISRTEVGHQGILVREDTATRRLRALSPKDITMSENIEDLKARLAQAEAAAKAAEAEAARAKAEALRAQLEAAGTSAAPSPEPQEAASPTPAMQEAAARGDATQPGPSSPEPASDLSPFAAHIQAAYSWDVPAVTVGTLIDEGVRVPGVSAAMPLPMFNRHLLVAGATGTGKTRTLQLLAEGLSAGGSSVLLCDVKGDLTGLAEPGASSDKLLSRAAANGQQWAASAFPVELLSLGGADAQFPGVPVRAEVSDFGPILLATRALPQYDAGAGPPVDLCVGRLPGIGAGGPARPAFGDLLPHQRGRQG